MRKSKKAESFIKILDFLLSNWKNVSKHTPLILIKQENVIDGPTVYTFIFQIKIIICNCLSLTYEGDYFHDSLLNTLDHSIISAWYYSILSPTKNNSTYTYRKLWCLWTYINLMPHFLDILLFKEFFKLIDQEHLGP